MSEWKKVRLGDVAELCLGKMLDAKKNKGTLRPYLNNVAVRWGCFDLVDLPEMRIEDAEVERYKIKKGDIVICEGGEPGRCAVWRSEEPIFFQKALHRARVKPCFDSNFIYYQLCHLVKSGETRNFETGSTIRHLPAQELKQIPIAIPPLTTQRKIGAVLGALDDKIENNRKICANLEAQAQAIFKSWFVDDTRHIRDTVQMQRVFDVTIGRTPPRKESEWFSASKDDNHVWVSIADMGSCGAFIFDSSEYLTDEAINKFNFKVVPRDTVLLSFKLTVGRVAVAATDLVTNEAIAHMRTSDIRLREYLYCYLRQFNYDNLGSTSSIATAVNSTTIKEMPIVVPKDKALSDFHQLVRPLFNQIRVLLHESRALAATRDALLPKLMSGEIDVEKVKVA